jgi:hypothetical protein
VVHRHSTIGLMAFSPKFGPPDQISLWTAQRYPRVTVTSYSSGMVDELGR